MNLEFERREPRKTVTFRLSPKERRLADAAAAAAGVPFSSFVRKATDRAAREVLSRYASDGEQDRQ